MIYGGKDSLPVVRCLLYLSELTPPPSREILELALTDVPNGLSPHASYVAWTQIVHDMQRTDPLKVVPLKTQ